MKKKKKMDLKTNKKVTKDFFKVLNTYTEKDISKDITKSIKMKGHTAKKLKLASSISGKKQGELVDILLDYYLDQVYENELKGTIKKLKKGELEVVDINNNISTIPEINS